MIRCFRGKTHQAVGEPRRFALYAPTEHTWSYRLNAVFGLFQLRI